MHSKDVVSKKKINKPMLSTALKIKTRFISVGDMLSDDNALLQSLDADTKSQEAHTKMVTQDLFYIFYFLHKHIISFKYPERVLQPSTDRYSYTISYVHSSVRGLYVCVCVVWAVKVVFLGIYFEYIWQRRNNTINLSWIVEMSIHVQVSRNR